MNVVIINKGGHSFKGLHAYLAHDTDRAQTSERVAWTDTRNIGTDNPEQAYKIMVATAKAQNQLKSAAGLKAGRKSTKGAVQHVLLAFDKDEPNSPEDMKAAVDEYLSHLGVDPAKMRGKNKPSARQFANEHQVVMYAHTDTDNPHVHLMINRVHPITGRNLPDNNDQLKSSDWALEYSKRHGTDHKTPAREENQEARKNGEYVKANNRKSRNVYEFEKALKDAIQDKDQIKTVLDEQRRKDSILLQKGRNMDALQSRDWKILNDNHKERRAAIGRHLQAQLNKIKAAVREEFRPQWRTLTNRQKAERQTFESLEKSFFGKASNIVKTVRLSANLLKQDKTGIISRTFRILTNAGDRKAYFERVQKRAQDKLKREQAARLDTLAQAKRKTHNDSMENSRTVYRVERKDLAAKHEAKQNQHKKDWQKRNEQRKGALQKALLYSKKIKAKFNKSKEHKAALDDAVSDILADIKHQEEFRKSHDHDRGKDEPEQSNDDEQER